MHWTGFDKKKYLDFNIMHLIDPELFYQEIFVKLGFKQKCWYGGQFSLDCTQTWGANKQRGAGKRLWCYPTVSSSQETDFSPMESVLSEAVINLTVGNCNISDCNYVAGGWLVTEVNFSRFSLCFCFLVSRYHQFEL